MSSEKGRTFTQLKWNDRLRIEKMLKEKKGKSEIARTFRVDYTTIMREIKRGLTTQRDTNLIEKEVYCAETAERKYQENLRAKGPDIKLGTVNFRRIFSTITVDNGSEFQDWEGMTRAATGDGERTHIYYCHPYSAFERGSNENGNRMIWRQVPKGTDFTEITEDDALRVQRWVNEYPRGILDGRCAGRVLLEVAKEAGIEGIDLLL